MIRPYTKKLDFRRGSGILWLEGGENVNRDEGEVSDIRSVLKRVCGFLGGWRK